MLNIIGIQIGIWYFLLFAPALCMSQGHLRNSRAYIGVQLHDDQPGFTLANSFGINKYFGIGAGVDLTSYDGKLLVPAYLDIRGRYTIGKWEPFILGQFGKNLYKYEDAITYTDMTGQGYKADKNGKFFYGMGIGAGYKIGRVGVYASYTFRAYKYGYANIKGAEVPEIMFPDFTVNANIISAGLVF